MFFQSLLPTFNLQNAGGNAGDQQQQQQQQNVIDNVEQAAARVAQDAAAAGVVDDDVAEVDRHLQALHMNLERGEGMPKIVPFKIINRGKTFK